MLPRKPLKVALKHPSYIVNLSHLILYNQNIPYGVHFAEFIWNDLLGPKSHLLFIHLPICQWNQPRMAFLPRHCDEADGCQEIRGSVYFSSRSLAFHGLSIYIFIYKNKVVENELGRRDPESGSRRPLSPKTKSSKNIYILRERYR